MRSGKAKFGVHPDVLKLGFVSFLTDVSSEMIFSVFAVFFTTIAGASAALLGLIEGLADLAAASLDSIAGWLSDQSGRRKAFAVAGYGFSTLAKVILLISASITAAGIFRIVERLGKSFRGPPRDAWLAAVASTAQRGYAFGVHRAMDKAGAVLGPLVAYGLLWWLGESAAGFRTLFRVAFLPAVLSLLVLSLARDRPAAPARRESPFEAWKTVSPEFKRFLVAAGTFALAYFSFGFLLLRALGAGFDIKDTVLLYALFNVSCVVAAPLIGRISDLIGRARMIMCGYATYALMSLGFAFATTRWQITVLFVVYGLFYAIDEAQSKAFVADLESERRASAIGLYNFVTGVIYLPASLLAGALWLAHPASAFLVAAGLASGALILFAALRRS